MNVFYWNKKKNFGDELGHLLLKHFCHFDCNWSEPGHANIVNVGSILELLPADYDGIIAGCGMLHESSRLEFPKAKIFGVRGCYTAARITYTENLVLGDPGLLADELVPLRDKEFDLGLVPHWTDKTLETNPTFLKYNPKIIRVSDDPLKVISEIGKCKKIVSSSLHGIILADAFNIPRRIELAPRMLTHPQQEGGLFKWKDYSSSLGVELKIGVTQLIDKNVITEKQHELFDLMEKIKEHFNYLRLR